MIFTEMLRTQLKWTWAVITLGAVCAFIIPLLSVQQIDMGYDSPADTAQAALALLGNVERSSVLYTLLAAGVGILVGMKTWSADHRGRHVYALTLPMERWRYVLNRFGGGFVLLIVPALALLISGALASSFVNIPEGLHAYPLALSVRFLLATFVAYALVFAISAGTSRTAAMVLIPLGLMLVADLVLAAMDIRSDLTTTVLGWLFERGGVMEIFTGRWLLFDV